MYSNYYIQISNFPIFITLFVLTFLAEKPRNAISPLSIFYGYYSIFYIIAPLFAERYQFGIIERPEYNLSFAFLYSVFGLGAISISLGEKYFDTRPQNTINIKQIYPEQLRKRILGLYILSSIFLFLIVSHSGGIQRWLTNPGDAFLNRGGSGVYVILSHFSSLLLASFVGYYSFLKGSKNTLIIFVIWLVVSSPIHGSKGQISLLLVLAFFPWLRNIKLFDFKSFLFLISFILIFFLGLYFRNFSWIDKKTFLPYALNYFTTLENLAVSVRDFEPQFLRTFFLPFTKLLSPIGISSPDMYFDMNHLLTDIYYPTAWQIRATEQWPVETDLYLNFYFFGGLPLVGLFLFIIGYIYSLAKKTNTLGSWMVALIVSFSLISHLRGSLYNFNDFYMYPYLILVYITHQKFQLNKTQINNKLNKFAP